MLTQKMNKSRVLVCVYIYSLLLSKAIGFHSNFSSYMRMPFDGGILFQVVNVSELISFSCLCKQIQTKKYPGEMLTKLQHSITPLGIITDTFTLTVKYCTFYYFILFLQQILCSIGCWLIISKNTVYIQFKQCVFFDNF